MGNFGVGIRQFLSKRFNGLFMKTIVFFHHGATLGGAPFSMLDIIKGADLGEYRIKVVIPKRGPLCRLLSEHQIDYEVWPFLVFYYCAPNKTFSLELPFLLNCSRLFKVIIDACINLLWMPLFLMRVKPDLVVINTSTPLLCGVLTRLFRIKLVWHVREIIAPAPNVFIKKMMALIINSSANKVVVNSEFSRRDLISLGIKDAAVIYNSVDLIKFNPVISRQGMREELGFKEPELVVGWTNQIGAHKGWRVLLKAAFILAKQLPVVRFLIVGASHRPKQHSFLGSFFQAKGEDEMFKEAVIKLGLEQHFIFLGVRTDIERVLRSMDCLVFPVEQPESFGKVIIEAMASGIPVVASKLGAVNEIIDGNRTGMLVEPNDPIALAQALEKILTDREMVQGLSVAARRTVEERFDKQQNIPKMWELYGAVLEGR